MGQKRAQPDIERSISELELIYTIEFTHPPLLRPLFHDPPPPSNADVISGSPQTIKGHLRYVPPSSFPRLLAAGRDVGGVHGNAGDHAALGAASAAAAL